MGWGYAPAGAVATINGWARGPSMVVAELLLNVGTALVSGLALLVRRATGPGTGGTTAPAGPTRWESGRRP
jgi:hypothetical protein